MLFGSAIAGGLLKPLTIRAKQKGLELTSHIPEDLADHLTGDPLRLRQILLNLTDNAIKFTDHGGVKLSVAAETGADLERYLHFTVSDTGAGIPAAKQALIFQAFAQAADEGLNSQDYAVPDLAPRAGVAWRDKLGSLSSCW